MKRMIVAGAAVLAVAAFAACGGSSSSSGQRSGGAEIDLDEAIVFFELNATDEDLGFHCKFDGEGWNRMAIRDLDGTEVFSVTNGGTLADLGSTEVFTESAEPPFTELDPADFLDLFPEGTYTFEGRTVEGDTLVGESELDHQMPSMPEFVATPGSGAVSSTQDLLIQWTLNASLPGGGVLAGGAAIEAFEVTVEQTDPNEVDPELTSFLIVAGSATELTIPAELLVANMELKVQVLAIAENGNKTSTEEELGLVNP